MKYRHEWKHEITAFDVLCLRQRLSAVMQSDPHASNGRYLVRSLYFDDLRDQALQDKLNGVSRREKFRLRCYNGDDSYLVLEKKSKVGGLCAKEQARLTRPQAEALLQGDPAALQAVMGSRDGQMLLGLLSGSDGGRTLQQAIRQAAAGDASAISGMLQGIMSTPQGAALVQRIGESLQK